MAGWVYSEIRGKFGTGSLRISAALTHHEGFDPPFSKGGRVEGQSPRRAPQSAKAPIRVLFAKLFLALLSQEKAFVGVHRVNGRDTDFKSLP